MSEAALPDGELDGFRSGLQRGKLLVPVCKQCETVLDYAQRSCAACGSVSLGWRAAQGRGFLRSVVEMSVSYVADLQAPFLVASVRLAEGPHLLSRYEGNWENAKGGQPVEARIENGILRFVPAKT